MIAEVVKSGRAQVGPFDGRRDHGRGGRYATAGEHPGPDVIDFLEVLLIAVIRHGDSLNQGGPVGSEQLGDLGEVPGKVFVSDGFDHLN